MYNKRQFKKLNDKKLLRKIGKHWVTVSIALLGLLGGGAAATHVSANADTTSNNDQNQANHQTNINQLQNSKATFQTNDQSNHSYQYVQNSQNQIHNNKSNSLKNITQQSNFLHNNILRNAINSHPNQISVSSRNNKHNNINNNSNNPKSVYTATATKSSSNVKTPSIVEKSNWDNINKLSNINYVNFINDDPNQNKSSFGSYNVSNGKLNNSDIKNILPKGYYLNPSDQNNTINTDKKGKHYINLHLILAKIGRIPTLLSVE